MAAPASERTWPVKVYGKGPSAGPVYLLVLLMVLVGLATTFLRLTGTPLVWPLYGLAGLLFVVFMVRSFVSARPRTASLVLANGILTLQVRGKTTRVPLASASLRFGRHQAAKSYSMFVGTVLHVAAGRNQALRLLGGGVEFNDDRYDAGESYGTGCDGWLEPDHFNELLKALEETLPDRLPDDPRGDGKAALTGTFQAFPLKGGVLGPMLIWMGGLFGITLLSFALTELLGNSLERYAPYVGLLVVPFLILTIFSATRKARRKGAFAITNSGLTYSVNGRTRWQLAPPFASVRPVDFRVRSRYGTYYSGPALEIRPRKGRVRRILIADQNAHWNWPEGTVGRGDCSISADAGHALIAWTLFHGGIQDVDLSLR